MTVATTPQEIARHRDRLAEQGWTVLEDAIEAEISEGRAVLNERLGTTTVRHVALPWGVAGDVTRRALKDSAHVTAFAERPLRRRGVRAGDERGGDEPCYAQTRVAAGGDEPHHLRGRHHRPQREGAGGPIANRRTADPVTWRP